MLLPGEISLKVLMPRGGWGVGGPEPKMLMSREISLKVIKPGGGGIGGVLSKKVPMPERVDVGVGVLSPKSVHVWRDTRPKGAHARSPPPPHLPRALCVCAR